MLPISKLRGVAPSVRVALKTARINTCGQLLAAAARLDDREILARTRNIDLSALTELVQRADLARIVGVGVTFGRMLEMIGICDVASLAKQAPRTLAAQLSELNARARLTRRSPSAEEVAAWIDQARKLPKLVSYAPHGREAAR